MKQNVRHGAGGHPLSFRAPTRLGDHVGDSRILRWTSGMLACVAGKKVMSYVRAYPETNLPPRQTGASIRSGGQHNGNETKRRTLVAASSSIADSRERRQSPS